MSSHDVNAECKLHLTSNFWSLDVLVDDVMKIIIQFIPHDKDIMCLSRASKRYNTLINNIIIDINRKNKYRADIYNCSIYSKSARYVPLENASFWRIIYGLQVGCVAHRHIDISDDILSEIHMMALSCCMQCYQFRYGCNGRYFKVSLYGVDNLEKMIDKMTVEYVEICDDCVVKDSLDIYYFSYIYNQPLTTDNIQFEYIVKHVDMLCNKA